MPFRDLRDPMRIPSAALLATLLLTILGAACTPPPADPEEAADLQTADAAASADTTDCIPLENRPPNVPDQSPAFPGQTRTCSVTSDVAFDVVVVAEGLEHPWAVEPLPGGDLLVTERPGRLR